MNNLNKQFNNINTYEDIDDLNDENYLTPINKNINKLHNNINSFKNKLKIEQDKAFNSIFKNNIINKGIENNLKQECDNINRNIKFNQNYLNQNINKLNEYNNEKQLFLNNLYNNNYNNNNYNKRRREKTISEINDNNLSKYLNAKYYYKMLKENKKIEDKINKPKKFGLSLFINI